jgi:hypothetical protein
VIRAHQPGSEPIDIPETIPNPVVRSKSSDLRASKIRYESEWPWGLTKQKLIAQMSERLNREIVGVDFSTDVAFHCVRCDTDMGLATAIWSCVYSRDATGMDCALRCDPGGNHACNKNAEGSRNASLKLDLH